jgi:hypothetical protein
LGIQCCSYSVVTIYGSYIFRCWLFCIIIIIIIITTTATTTTTTTAAAAAAAAATALHSSYSLVFDIM